MLCQNLISGVVFTGMVCAAAHAEPLDVAKILARPVIDSALPLSEVQAYCETRVPPMPEPVSVSEWETYVAQTRKAVLDQVVFRGEAKRWRSAPARVEWLDTLAGGPGYRIRKLRFEALPGLWIPALLYEPLHLDGRVPVVLNVNGHDRKHGKAATYKQMRCINQAKRGMLALNVEWLGMGQLNADGFLHYRMNQLDLCGTSGLAPFYLSMSRSLDLLLAREHADPKRVAVAGLSGGGWQTSIISALDPRVVLSNPVAGYSSFRTRVRFLSDLGDPEQTPCDLATVTDYSQLTAMRAPRPTLLTFNASDNCCFRAEHALPPLLDAARPIFALYGKPGNLRAHINQDPGTHNFEKDNRQALYRMLGDFFFPNDAAFDPLEIPSEDELKAQDELTVPLPDDNLDFHQLALQLSRNLPDSSGLLPLAPEAAGEWREQQRNCLSEVVRSKSYSVAAELVSSETGEQTTARFWKLRLGEHWTVPAVEFRRGDAQQTAVLVADKGRKEAAAATTELLNAGWRVVAVDPFYFGESHIPQRDFLFALLVAAVGDRPLGLQASQVAAIARWAANDAKDHAVKLVALGPRSSLFSLVAAGLDETAIASLELHDSFSSLKDVILKNLTAREAPELFCFGLLEQFDIPLLTSLVKPRTVEFVTTGSGNP